MQPSNCVDPELLARMRRRDPDALSAVYDLYGGAAYALFFRMTHDKGAAEDLVQELFIRFWNRSRGFDSDRGSLATWILSIARNMAIDYIRSAQTRAATRSRPIEDLDRISIPYSNRSHSAIDNARMVSAALENLNSNQKKVLELAYYEGFSQSEIAAQLRKPLGTVKSLMRSALDRLHDWSKLQAVPALSD